MVGTAVALAAKAVTKLACLAIGYACYVFLEVITTNPYHTSMNQKNK